MWALKITPTPIWNPSYTYTYTTLTLHYTWVNGGVTTCATRRQLAKGDWSVVVTCLWRYARAHSTNVNVSHGTLVHGTVRKQRQRRVVESEKEEIKKQYTNNKPNKKKKKRRNEKVGSAEIRTRILGFRVPGANRYTTEPAHKWAPQTMVLNNALPFREGG